MNFLIFMLTYLAMPSPDLATEASELRVTVTNISPAKGILHIDLYQGEEKFMFKEHAIKNHEVDVAKNTITYTIKNIPSGSFAVCVWHDANKNGYMDKNFLGIPKEGYGFANNPSCLVGPPKYRSCTIDASEKSNIEIRMNN